MPEEEALVFHDLTASDEDRTLLRRFHDDVYAPEFPDPNEKESLVNIERYLELKSTGSYQANGYHVLVVESRGHIIGGAIADYLADPNAGVVEFLVIAPASRGGGLGRKLLDQTETLIRLDAQRAGRLAPARIVAEIEDPFLVELTPHRFDPFARARIWGGWGFRKLHFPYVQPALSETQRPVHHLMLASKPLADDERGAVPVERILETLHAYMRWAMRIPEPDASPEYRGMRDYLEPLTCVPSISLERYIGRDPAVSVRTDEVTGEGAAFEAVLDVYGRAFAPDATALDVATFRDVVLARLGSSTMFRYHLWAIRATPGLDIAGMASFFSLPGIGFGGYVVLDDTLRGRGRARSVVAQIEERMRLDGTGARGWLVECAPGSHALEVCARLGFSEIALDYQQPPLGHASAGEVAPRLCLMYKDFGAVYSTPTLIREELRAALRVVYRIVYGIETPERHPYFVTAEAQMKMWPTDRVEWRAAPQAR